MSECNGKLPVPLTQEKRKRAFPRTEPWRMTRGLKVEDGDEKRLPIFVNPGR
jgi:hypothetical protein